MSVQQSKVFVTGPDGLLGSHVIRELLCRNHIVKAMVQTGKEPKTIMHLPIEIVYGDITVKEDLEMHSEGCDYFIHIAAVTDTWPTQSAHYYKINLEGTNNAISAALRNGIKRFVHVGSASSFGFGSKTDPGNEGSYYRGGKHRHDYLESKRAAQLRVVEAVKSYNLPAVVVCPTFMIGAYDSKPGPGAVVVAIAKRELPFASGGGKNWVAAKDVATGIANALELGRIGECYILGGHNLSYVEAIKKIAETLGQKSYPKRTLPNSVIILAGMVQSQLANFRSKPPKLSYTMARLACEEQYYCSKKAIRELRMPQTPIGEAIKDLKHWFEENGYL